jgi:tetratricopeptide (TPR) repeat protein
MKNRIAPVLLFLICFLYGWEGNPAFAQDDEEEDVSIDSLKLALKNTTQDSTRCKLLFDLIGVADDDELPVFNDQLLKICEDHLRKTKPGSKEAVFYNRYYAEALNNVGYIADQSGDAAKALEFYNKSLTVSEALDDKEGIATSLNNVGTMYNHLGDIGKTLEYYGRSLKIREAMGDTIGITNSLNNIGIVYSNQGDLVQALNYYTKGLKMREAAGDEEGISRSLNNIGSIYDRQGDFEKALDCYERSLEIKTAADDQKGMAVALNNIGRVYSNKGELPKALDYLQKGLKLREDIDDKSGVAFSLQNISNVYFKQKKYPQAIAYGEKSMTLSKELGFPENIRNAAEQLNIIYTATGNYKAALENYTLFIAMRDKIQNTENAKATIQRQVQYNYDKKAAADSVVNAKQAEINNAQLQQKETEIKAKRNQQYALYGGLVLVLIFAGFMYNRFKVTSKKKDIIELKEKQTQSQKNIIE